MKLKKCRHMEMRGGIEGWKTQPLACPADSRPVVVSLKLTGQIQWDSARLPL